MSEPPSALTPSQNLPPPAPPLPPARLGPLQRFIAPLVQSKPARGVNEHTSSHAPTPTRAVTRPSYGSTSSESNVKVQHRTGIPIAALDINKSKTHAILAGRDILKTVRVHEGRATEDLNLRSSIVSYASTHGSPQGDAATRRRDYLPARDVKWSTGGLSSHVVATAATNGRIALYDVNAAGSRIELAWLHEHTGQVNKIDIDPFAGRYLLSASQDKTVKLWDIRDPKSAKSKTRFEVRTGVRHVCWSPKEGNDFDFAICADGGIIQNWDLRNPIGPKISIHAHDRGCYSLDWHPDGRHVVSGGFDRYIRVWDFKSDSRRQKPTFSFRAPQSIRSVSWRPLSESDDAWQTSQLATTYHEGDPRIHVWDLKRPFLPVVELATFSQPANDFIWASATHIWAAGDDGIFGQYNMESLPRTGDTITPAALTWLPGGYNAMFLEERQNNDDFHFDPSGFLSIPKDKLSSGNEGHQAPLPETDEVDEASHRVSINSSVRTRQGRELSYMSDISRASSPPDHHHVQQLDKTVNAGKLLLHNYQIGAIGQVPTAPDDARIAAFLANNYAPIASEAERRNEPEMILTRLEACLMNNAEICDEVALHRLAQSWRIVASVLIPELKEWAEDHRVARRREADQRKAWRRFDTSSARAEASPSFVKVTTKDRSTKVDTKDTKVMSNLFRGVKDPGRYPDHEISSSMTTPLARPLPDSPSGTPRHTRSQDSSSSLSLIEDIPPLPESLMNSHATAAAASHALHDEESSSPLTSPRHKKRENLQPPSRSRRSPSQSSTQALDPSEPLPRASPFLQAQKTEERRAALRDYRAQARPIFSLETQAQSPVYERNSQQDSAESFPMFPASTSSSHKARSMGQSIGTKGSLSAQKPIQESWLSRTSTESSSSSAWGLKKASQGSFAEQNTSTRDFSISSEAPPFNMDATPELEEDDKLANRPENAAAKSAHHDDTFATSPDMFPFDAETSPAKVRIHNLNPILHPRADQAKLAAKATSVTVKELDESQLAREQYIFEDIRPVDMCIYQPKLPFAWSTFPLVCQLIAYDIDNGIACAQFAAHLLLHLSPYFFSKPIKPRTAYPYPETLAERLMIPELAGRVIETLLRKHLSFLSQLHLFVPLAGLRKTCAELGYTKLESTATSPSSEQTLSSKTPYLITIACSNCGTPMTTGRSTCESCRRSRKPCPICQSFNPPAASTTLSQPSMWVVCQSCGHGAHSGCMYRWQSTIGVDGICPTGNCACDCAPGRLRDIRIERQARAYEERKLIRGAGNGTSGVRKDEMRASPSPAVDRARAVMRAGSGERKGSGDERVAGRRASARGSVGGANAGGQGGMSSSRKSVRVVMPGEEKT